jgi:hypothetical protein
MPPAQRPRARARIWGRSGAVPHAPGRQLKSGITGPDSGNSSFFFSGRSFAIPGTSGPVGLPNFRKRNGPQFAPDLIYWGLRLTAVDLKPRNFGGDIGPQRVDNADGFDLDTGYGFVDARNSTRAIRGF